MSRRLPDVDRGGHLAVAGLLKVVPARLPARRLRHPPIPRKLVPRRKPRGARPTCRDLDEQPRNSVAAPSRFGNKEVVHRRRNRRVGQAAHGRFSVRTTGAMRRAASRMWAAPTTPPSSFRTNRPAGGHRSSSTRRTGAFRR